MHLILKGGSENVKLRQFQWKRKNKTDREVEAEVVWNLGDLRRRTKINSRYEKMDSSQLKKRLLNAIICRLIDSSLPF